LPWRVMHPVHTQHSSAQTRPVPGHGGDVQALLVEEDGRGEVQLLLVEVRQAACVWEGGLV